MSEREGLLALLDKHVDGVRHYLHLQIGRPINKDLISAPEIALDNLHRELREALAAPAQAVPDPVQDTWLAGGPDLKAMSGSVESDRVIQLHFRRKATDADRKWLLDAINAKIAADRVSLSSTHEAPRSEDQS